MTKRYVMVMFTVEPTEFAGMRDTNDDASEVVLVALAGDADLPQYRVVSVSESPVPGGSK